MYLITKWFGTFLFDENGLKEKILFPKNIKSISTRLIKIRNNEILTEEKKISQNIKDIIVCEKRLKELGEYRPNDPNFNKFKINSDEFGFSNNLLQKAILITTENLVKEELTSEDQQIIQMINTLDDFLRVSNLLSERLLSWSVIPDSKEKMLHLKKTISSINKEKSFFEKQIEKDMEKVAPNLNNLVGSLIGARLISLSGGIKKLALLPSSTIQVLGAEKALFRFKKEGGKPPKHGIIFQHPYISTSSKNIRGKIAKILASKISIAVKADVFTKRNISDYLKKDLENLVKDIKNK
jgi:nucleolar protein 56